MSVDCTFTRGRTHTVCEDYALVIDQDGRKRVAVSDGCSESPATDFGSRFLCVSAIDIPDPTDGNGIINRALGMARACGLPSTCLDATLLLAWYDAEQKGTNVIAWGDGIVAARKRNNGSWTYRQIEFTRGAPGYLSYSLDPGRKAVFMEECDGHARIIRHVHQDGTLISEDSTGANTLLDPVEFFFSEEHYDIVMVLTDGSYAFQLLDRGKPAIPQEPHDTVMPLLTVRNPHGEFVQRTVNKNIERLARRGIYPADDVGAGGIHMELPC